MYSHSEIDYGNLILFIVIVVLIVAFSLYVITKTRKIPQNDKTRTYIVSGIVLLISGFVYAGLSLALSETPWNEFGNVLYKTLLFRKIRMPNLPDWKDGAGYLNAAYAIAAAGLMLMIIGFFKSLINAIFIGETEQYYPTNERTMTEEGQLSRKSVIFKENLQTKHIIFIVILLISLTVVPGLIVYFLGHALPQYAVSGLIVLFMVTIGVVSNAVLPGKAKHFFIGNILKKQPVENTLKTIQEKPGKQDILDQISDFQKDMFTKDLHLTIKDVVHLVLISIVIIVVIYLIASRF